MQARPRNPDRSRERRADATLRAYASDWAAFTSWCLLENRPPLPASPEAVLSYLKAIAPTCRLSSLRRKLVAIRQTHRFEGHELRLTAAALAGIVAPFGPDQAPRARPAVSEDGLRRMIQRVPQGIAGIRDKAMILLMWTLRCRPAELVGLDRRDLAVGRGKITVALRAGPVVLRLGEDTLLCALSWLRGWLDIIDRNACEQDPGDPIFRGVTRFGKVLAGRLTVQTVRLVVMRAAVRAGVPADQLSADGLRKSPPAAPRGHGRPGPRRSSG